MLPNRSAKLDPRFHTLPPYHPDPRAVRLAQTLLQQVHADNVVVFGSRARGDWNRYSDIDLLVVQAPDSEWDKIRAKAHELARSLFGKGMNIDLVHRTHRECHIQIQHSVNGIAAVALREGAAAAPYPQPLNEPDPEPDPNLEESGEMELRMASANESYGLMQYALDGGWESDSVAVHARQALEQALKALISAQGSPYPHGRKLGHLRRAAGLDTLTLSRNLDQLDQYAGGDAYRMARNPIADFASAANDVTDDLVYIYAQIERLTGTDAWDVHPPGAPGTIESRRR